MDRAPRLLSAAIADLAIPPLSQAGGPRAPGGLWLWNLAFVDVDPVIHPVQIALKRGYRHVWAFASIGAHWLVLDPGLYEFRPLVITAADLAERLERARASILEVEKRAEKAKVRFRAIPSCVSFATHLIAHDRLAVTPWQLYRQLRSQPGVKRL